MDAGSPSVLRLGLTGWPLGHSLSPRLHQAALAALHLVGEYRLYPVPPLPEGQGALAELVQQMRLGRLHGLNVTIPHKQSVLPLLDELTPAASAIGAVNTIYRRAGRLVGHNTDAPGFLADLEQLGFAGLASEPRPKALVLGAGGAARAVCCALAQAGWQVCITARRFEQASALAANLNAQSWAASALTFEPASLLLPFSLIINTTPVGMYPDVQANPWPAGIPFPPGAAVYDLVYNPPETALIRAARAAGLPAANGLGMLVEQAALAFEVWTGRTVPRLPMLKAANFKPEAP